MPLEPRPFVGHISSRGQIRGARMDTKNIIIALLLGLIAGWLASFVVVS